MPVTVTWLETTEGFIPQRRTTEHPAGRSVAVDDQGRLLVFDYRPTDRASSREESSLGHTVAVYAAGAWVSAARS